MPDEQKSTVITWIILFSFYDKNDSVFQVFITQYLQQRVVKHEIYVRKTDMKVKTI